MYQKVEKFKYIGVVFTSDGRRNKEIDTQIGKTNTVLREVYLSVVIKRELWSTTRLLLFKSVFVPIFTYGHESWVMTERMLSQVQAAEMGFLRRVHGVTRAPGKIGEARLAGYNTSGRTVQRPGLVITSPTWISPILLFIRKNYLWLLPTVRYFVSLKGYCIH